VAGGSRRRGVSGTHPAGYLRAPGVNDVSRRSVPRM
jgi:hypothetical protein